MNVIEIENKRIELLSNLNNKTSNRQKLFLIVEFFDALLQCGDQSIIYSYLLEFSEDFAKYLEEWDVFYLPPQESDRVLKLAETLREHPAFKPSKEKLALTISKLENNFLELDNILKGSNIPYSQNGKIYFPILEDDGTASNGGMYSYLESITVKISKGSSKNKFIIVPSVKVIEENLNNQIKISWEKAVDMVKRHRARLNQYHDVIINFDQRLGEYAGNSLGIALTLAFLQELFTLYNSAINLKVPAKLAFSGGMGEDGKIIPISNEDYIKSKIRCVFFSPVNRIVLHRNDEESAKNELNKLYKNYPERELKIIGIEEIDDLINRRDLVEIKKQNFLMRSGRFIKKQKFAVAVLILTLLGILYLNIDFDNNPYSVSVKGLEFYVHNKAGRVLWQKKQTDNFNDPTYNKGNTDVLDRIIDINGDGKNEVLVSSIFLDNNRNYYVACFNNYGKVIWKYQYSDFVKTKYEKHTLVYSSQFIDTLTENGNLELLLIARNGPLYPSAIYKLDARTGERLPGTFWHAGHIQSALIENIDKDKEKKIIAVAISNCYERCVLFSLDVDSINGQGPANGKYTFLNIKKAKLNHYILLPKTDITDYFKTRFNINPRGSLILMDNKYYEFTLIEGKPDLIENGIVYDIGKTFSNIKISIGDTFQVFRDSLVSSGKLHKPYSNTQEYTNILKKQIKYWDGKEFKSMY